MSFSSRRNFVKRLAITLASTAAMPQLLNGQQSIQAAPTAVDRASLPGNARQYWISLTERIAGPVLENLAARTLKKNMPVDAHKPESRVSVTHLEALGRLLCGIAPWLETDQPDKWVKLARESIDAATDSASPDFMNFKTGSQPLVDAAFFAQGLLRAPKNLWEALDERVKKNVIAALKTTRRIRPGQSNWLLFAAMVEAFMQTVGEDVVRPRVDQALKKHMEWYKGDGAYGDGPNFHWDYYNGFVIQPMLVDVTSVFSKDDEWGKYAPVVLKRAQRYAAIQERLISPEGTYPPMGRSLTYRFGAFQPLVQMALLNKLPKAISPAQVRCAMTTMVRRQMEAPGTFDKDGWLEIGFCGHQKKLADYYISTGSLYLCAAGLLALGLPAKDPFWSASDEPWTSVKAWSGVDIPGDHAIS